MKLLFAASVALALIAGPAAAVPVPVMKVMGADFYSRCTNPANHGQAVVSICAAYVAGVADEMQNERTVCLPPRATAPQLLPPVLNWMRVRIANGAAPAAIQIRTGLMTMFPCRPVAKSAPPKQQMSLGDAIDLGSKFVALWKEAAPLIMAILH
jgi:hypothetical protein